MPKAEPSTPRPLPQLPDETEVKLFVGPSDVVYARCPKLNGRKVYPLDHPVVTARLYQHLRTQLGDMPTKAEREDLRLQAVAAAYESDENTDLAFDGLVQDDLAFAIYQYCHEQFGAAGSSFRVKLKTLREHLILLAKRDGIDTQTWKTAPTALNAFSHQVMKREVLLQENGVAVKRGHTNGGSVFTFTLIPSSLGSSPRPSPAPSSASEAVNVASAAVIEASEPRLYQPKPWAELVPGTDFPKEFLKLAKDARRPNTTGTDLIRRLVLIAGPESEFEPVSEMVMRTAMCLDPAAGGKPCGECDQCRLFNVRETLDQPQPNDAFRYAFLQGKELTAAEVERSMSRLSGWTGPLLLYISHLEEVEEAAHGALARWLQWNRVVCLAGCERTDRLSPKLLDLFPWQWVTGSGTGFPEPVVQPAEGDDSLSGPPASLSEDTSSDRQEIEVVVSESYLLSASERHPEESTLV